MSVAKLKVFFQPSDNYASLHTIFENAIFEKALTPRLLPILRQRCSATIGD